jgi:hypothetical protein
MPGHDGLDNTEPEKVVITGRGDEALLRADVPVIHVLGATEDVDGRDKPTAVRFDLCGQGAWR